jgi:hypothetical protein
MPIDKDVSVTETNWCGSMFSGYEGLKYMGDSYDSQWYRVNPL